MEILNKVTEIILFILAVFVAYKAVMVVIGFVSRSKKYPETDIRKKYAIIISARNEENVIGNLLDSLHKQNYPKELLTIFVVADNCSDNTAQICRDKGAVVYERHDPSKARKGWALEFLFENIKKDYGIESFDNYIFFDADNLVDSNYVMEMNKAIVSGAKACVGYRNTKNFGTNFVSSSYGINFYRQTNNYLRSSSVLGTSAHVSGTGFCLSCELLKNGWKWHTLTEDLELTANIIASGEIIHYCEKAQLYDEQPTSIFVSWRQRLRWARGGLAVFFQKGGMLIKNIFRKNRTLRSRWSSYETFWFLFPYSLFTLVIGAIYPIASTIITLIQGLPLPWITWLKGIGIAALSYYVTSFIEGLLTLIREHKHTKCHWAKRILLLFLWPWYDLMGTPILISALFIPVKWKPIVHKDQTKIETLENFNVKKVENDEVVDGQVAQNIETSENIKDNQVVLKEKIDQKDSLLLGNDEQMV